MLIERMNKGQWGKVRAFFDIKTDEGLVVKGFKLVEGSNGFFVGNPSQKNTAGEYFDTVYAEAELKEKITKLAMEAYGEPGSDQGNYQPSAPPADNPPDFSDDDIPF